MTDLIPSPSLDAVPQIETNTLVLGGFGGPANQQAQAILNRQTYFEAALADSADPSKGAGMVGWLRSPLASSIDNAHKMLDAQFVNAWEFAGLITSKPNPLDPTTWDWTPALQAAINYCSPLNGTLLLPLLNPCQHTGLTLKQGVSLLGHGLGTVLLNTGTGHAFIWTGDTAGDTSPRQSYIGSPTRLHSVTYSNFVNKGNMSSLDGFHMTYTEKYGRGSPAFFSIQSINHGQDGFYWELGDNLRLDNCYSMYNGRHGINVFQNSNTMQVIGGSYTANGARGIYLNQVASSCRVSGATIHDNATNGIFAQRCEQPLIYDCGFNGNGFSTTQDHAVIELFGDVTKVTESAVIQGCLFGGNSPLGADIHTTYVKSALIQSAYIFNVAATKPYIVRLGTESHGVVIRGARWNITAGTPLKVSVQSGVEATVDFILEDDEAQNSATGVPDITKRVDILYNQLLEYRPRNINNILWQTRVTGSEVSPFFSITAAGKFSWRRDGDNANPLRSLSINTSDQLEFAGRLKTDLGYITNGGAFSDRPLQLGAEYFWTDSFGMYRQKSGSVPTSAIDGAPLGKKVGIPATSSTSGAPGQWAADTSFFYVYTGDGTTHTWRRVAITTW